MDFLFFDIECAKHDAEGAAICSFGYVLTNDKFEIKEQEDIIINPKSRFDRVVENDILVYSRKVFEKAPPFGVFYPRIKELLSAKDRIVIGHSVENDVDYIYDELIRYGLQAFDFKFYDSQILYKTVENIENQIGLNEMLKRLGIAESDCKHKSDEDAKETMLAVKKMCELKDMTLTELIASSKYCSGEMKDGRITLDRAPHIDKTLADFAIKDNLLKGKNYTLFRKYITNVKKDGDNNVLAGKKFCFSQNLEYPHFRETVAAIKLLTDMGGKYTMNTESADYFVMDDDRKKYCARYKSVRYAIAKGKRITLLTREQFLEMLETTEEELKAMPFPNTILNPKIEKERVVPFVVQKTAASATVAELLSNKKSIKD